MHVEQHAAGRDSDGQTDGEPREDGAKGMTATSG